MGSSARRPLKNLERGASGSPTRFGKGVKTAAATSRLPSGAQGSAARWRSQFAKGPNRQIRRVLASLGHKVRDLDSDSNGIALAEGTVARPVTFADAARVSASCRMPRGRKKAPPKKAGCERLVPEDREIGFSPRWIHFDGPSLLPSNW